MFNTKRFLSTEQMTSKLVLAIITLVAISAISVPALAVSRITSADIVDGTIQSVDIKDGTIQSVDLAAGAVTNAKITDNAVTSGKIADHTIASNDIASGAVKSNSIVRQSDITTFHDGDFTSIVASCQPGETLTGGGYATGGGPVMDIVTDKPDPDTNSWLVSFIAHGDSSARVYAVCLSITP